MTNTQKFIIPIKGMHCKSCEILIEEQLGAIKGVKKVEANHRKDSAEIYYHGKSPDLNAINEAVEKAGYTVGKEEKRGWFSKNKNDYQELGMAALFLLGLYFILKGLGLTNINILPSGDGGVTVPLILLVGLTAGFSTCMALVGGLVLGISARHNELHPEATPMEKFRPHLFFNLGRVAGYTVLGGLLGLLGSTIQLSPFSLGILTIAVGLVMLTMGLQLIEIFPWAHKLKLTLPKSISSALGVGGQQKEYSHKNSLILGASTFFLPCGFTQAMQVIAISTGNLFYGALVMGLFALGTVPGLLTVGGLASTVKGAFAHKFFKFAGLVVLIFALFNINNGFTLAGFNLAYSQAENAVNLNDPNVTLENGVQVVRMKETANGYSPNSFTIQRGVPVKWVIDAEAPFSCASSLVMQKYNIRKTLSAGENIIEFTPTETGRIPFSCSMGMYTGAFNVVDKNGASGASSNNIINAANAAAPRAGGCGGGGTVAAGAPAAGGCGGGGAASASAGSCGGGSGCGCGGGGAQIKKDTTNTVAQVQGDTQIINAVYTAGNYLSPNAFKVKAGTKVKLNIDVKDDGQGCGYAIMIPGLYNNAIPLKAGQPIAMEFTPTTAGSYSITCSMQMINFGTIVVE